jgi:hypothetical protein
MTSSKQNPNALTTDEHDAVKTQHNKAGHQPVTAKNEPRRTPKAATTARAMSAAATRCRRAAGAAGPEWRLERP